MSQNSRGLRERLAAGETLLVAEGYLLEFVRRGRLSAGGFVPEVVLDNPESVKALHQEFVDAGSDVVQAFTYYTLRSKMREIGREEDLEKINKQALQLAKEVARKNGKLFAGGLCNSKLWDPDNSESIEETTAMFREQTEWAKEAGVDYMIAETFSDYGEASLALSVLKEFEMPCVVTLGVMSKDPAVTYDGVPIPEAICRLAEEGADVVGLNCARGPKTMIPVIKEIRAVYKGPLACSPVCYRTTEEQPNMQRLTYIETGEKCYPLDLQMHAVPHSDITWFGEQCKKLNVFSVGLCCGNDPSYTRTLAEVLGKSTSLDRYKANRRNNAMVADTTHKKDRYYKLGVFSGVRDD